MTEGEWLECADPKKMLGVVRDTKRQAHYRRKLRLFGAACCRHIWNSMDKWSRGVVDVAERVFDANGTQDDVDFIQRERGSATRVWLSGTIDCRGYGIRAASAVLWSRQAADTAIDAMKLCQNAMLIETGGYDTLPPGGRRSHERRYRELWRNLVYDIFGNPFRPVVISPAWRNPTVTSLAQAAYEER